MANEKNLIPIKTLSTEEAKKRGAAGGRASGEARRRRKSLRENMELLLDLPVSDKRAFNKIGRMYVDVEAIDNAMMLTVALFQRAADGDVAAYREIRDLIGEATPPKENDSILDLIAGLKDAD